MPSKVRLVFQVRDVDLERQRLIELGVEVGVPFDNREEGYREIRLHDPDGNSLTLFAWIDPARATSAFSIVATVIAPERYDLRSRAAVTNERFPGRFSCVSLVSSECCWL